MIDDDDDMCYIYKRSLFLFFSDGTKTIKYVDYLI